MRVMKVQTSIGTNFLISKSELDKLSNLIDTIENSDLKDLLSEIWNSANTGKSIILVMG